VKYLSSIIIASAVLCSHALGADFTGKIVNPDGKPAKNVTVYYFQYPRGGVAAPTARRDAPTTRSDDTGDFHFSQADGNGELVATADGFGFGMAQNANQQHPIEIHLTRGTDVTLTFTTADKKPAVGVAISLGQLYGPQVGGAMSNFWVPEGFRSPWSATTDANGVCTFHGLVQGAQANFSVDDDRYASLTYRDQVVLASASKTQADPIQLFAAATISGKVTNSSTGAPAAGIVVDAETNESSPTSATTAADGTYTLKQLRPGQYIVALHPDSDLEKSWTAKAVENIPVPAGAAKTGIDLSLIPGVILSGSVVAADDGSPVAGVPLGIYGPAHPRDGNYVESVNTDAAGHFTARVPAGEQLVYIMSDTPADGFGRPSPDNKTVTIADGATASVDFRLPRVTMSPIKGKVVDPDGNPVGGATVYAASDQSPMFQNNPITANADGTFQTMPMIRAGRIEIRAKSGSMATPKAMIVTRSSPGDVVVQLEKDALGSIAGRVVDAQGLPIKGARIEIITQTPRFSFGSDAGATDENGNFKADSLWADSNYIIQVSCNGYGQASSSQLHLQPGQTTTPHDLTLFKRDSVVAGVLLDGNNNPVAGQRIFVNGPRTGYNNLTTDSQGKFNCTVVSGDRLTVFYYVGRGYNRQSAKAGDENIVLHTSPPRTAPPAPAAHVAVATATPEVADTSSAPSAVSKFDPADAVTWQGWLYAIILLVVGGAVVVIANAIAGMRRDQASV
jgi:hypothetical protein